MSTKEIKTLGAGKKSKLFAYSGSVQEGVVVRYLAGEAQVSAALFCAILSQFHGDVPGGFSETNPTPGGLGEWVRDHSEAINRNPLTPRHASHIAAILVHEGCVSYSLDGNAVWLHFPKRDV
jgi:hypothetical protein